MARLTAITTQYLRTKKSTAKRSRANVRTLKSITFDQIRSIGFFGAKVSRVDRGKSRQNARHLPPVVIPLLYVLLDREGTEI